MEGQGFNWRLGFYNGKASECLVGFYGWDAEEALCIIKSARYK